MLTGKYKPGERLPGRLPRHRRQGRRGHDHALAATTTCSSRVQQLQPIADEAGLSLAQLAVAWVLQNRNVSAAIIGASRPEQVTENVKAAGVTARRRALLKRIDEVLDGVVERDPAKTVARQARLRPLTAPARASALLVQAHRPVDLPVALEERDLVDARRRPGRARPRRSRTPRRSARGSR